MLLLTLAVSARISAVAGQDLQAAGGTHVAKAVRYLVTRFNPELGLVYESDDSGEHWLRAEIPTYRWRYNQTYWLCSDNLFAAYALAPYEPELSGTIRQTLSRYGRRSELFELVIGEYVPTIRDAVNHIVESSSSRYVVVNREHTSVIPSWGVYADLICYRTLQLLLEGRYRDAQRCVHQVEALWTGKGLDDWSYVFVDGFYSNQKLALLLYTAQVLGVTLRNRESMEAHLWDMQQENGGIASLSNKEGKPMGSANTETIALTLLVYNTNLIGVIRMKSKSAYCDRTCLVRIIVPLTSIVCIWFLTLMRKRKRMHRTMSCYRTC